MLNGKEILRLTGITKSYSGTTVLSGINFVLHEGEIHCIVGENGAGKSTFIKILSGALKMDSGRIVAFGQKIAMANPQMAIDIGITTMYQDVDLVETLTVADNVYLGMELKKYGFIDKKKQNEGCLALLNTLKIKLDPETMVEQLSPAQKQMLQIVKALNRNAKVIIMDEPTASLGEEESAALIKIIKELAESGIGIIYISHYLEEVFELADTITVIKDGCAVGCYGAKEVSSEKIIKDMVGRDASLFYDREENKNIGEDYLEVRELTNLPLVNNISFKVKKGEIFGIGGLVGSGRTELVRSIFGADPIQKGAIYKNGKKLVIKSPKDAIANGICMLGEDRKGDGIFLERSIMENICVAKNEPKFFVSPKQDRIEAESIGKKMNLKMTGVDQEIQRLSGGNQQKGIIARWLLTDCDVIIFDEPTKGVDIGAREEIYKLMMNFVKGGKTIIMVSSDMPELLSMSDRICVLREGHMVGILDPKGLKEEDLLKVYLGASGNEGENNE